MYVFPVIHRLGSFVVLMCLQIYPDEDRIFIGASLNLGFCCSYNSFCFLLSWFVIVFMQYIPCNVRASLAAYIQEHMNATKTLQYKRIEPALVTFESRSYHAVFKHRAHYSKFCGSAWFEFTQDYALRAGDHVVFTLDHMILDVKVDTYRAGERILPSPCVGKFLVFFSTLHFLCIIVIDFN